MIDMETIDDCTTQGVEMLQHLLYRDAICPTSTAEVMARVREDKKGKRVNKKLCAAQ